MKFRLLSIGASGLVTLMGLGVTAVPAVGYAAQQSGIEEVVVTARKREERLQDLPGSAAALNEAFLEQIGGINDLRDLTDLIPGMTMNEAQDAALVEPSIRGAGQSRNRMSVSATGIYRNGAYIADKGIAGRNFARMDSFDLQRVEVLRGAQGALYGRNALGGAINLISKRPTRDLDVRIKVATGELDRLKYEGIVNIPLTDQFAARLSYVRDDRDDGFYKALDGSPVDDDKYHHTRLALRYEALDGNLDINYVYDTQEQEFASRLNIRRNPNIREFNNNDEFQTTINSPQKVFNDLDNHSLQVDYSTNNGIFTWIANFRRRDPFLAMDTDYSQGNINNILRNQTNNTTTEADTDFHELRYVSMASGSLNWMVGTDYYSTKTHEHILVLFPRLIDDTIARFDDPTGMVYERNINIQQDSWAVYGSLEYDFPSMPLALGAEIRYAKDQVGGEEGTIRPYVCGAVVLCSNTKGELDFDNMPWGLNASWRLADELLPEILDSALVYAKASSSYRHGGLNLAEGLPSDAYPTKPLYAEETAITYEVGAKTAWFNNRLILNLAAFKITYEDFLDTTTNGCPDLCTMLDVDTFVPLGYNADGTRIEVDVDGNDALDSPIAYFIDNIGEIDAWGYEIELQSRIRVAGGSLMTSLAFSRQLGTVESIRSDVSPANLGLLNKPLNQMRPKQWTANVRYIRPLPGSGIFSGNTLVTVLTWINESGGYSNLGVTQIPLEDFGRGNLRLGLDTDHWSLFLSGTNVTDERYLISQNNTNLTTGFYRRNKPKYYSLEFTWRLQ